MCMQGEGVAVINRWAGKLTKSWCVSNIISVCATTPQEVEECTVDLDQVKNIELSISRTSAGEGEACNWRKHSSRFSQIAFAN